MKDAERGEGEKSLAFFSRACQNEKEKREGMA
jgi:hypothetical protein